MRIYIDTSVIGGCCDEEFAEWSLRLMQEFRDGIKIAVISDITLQELEIAPEIVRLQLKDLPPAKREYVILDDNGIFGCSLENLVSYRSECSSTCRYRAI